MASAAVVLLPVSSLAVERPPSVVTQLRLWVATEGGPNPSAALVAGALRAWAAGQGGSTAQPQAPAMQPQASAPSPPAPATSPPARYPSGCVAALLYLYVRAAPGFVASCPHPDGGYQATTTCVGAPQCQRGTAFIWIEDPCPAAYMNEASNSWVLLGRSSARIDPFGYCGETGNPYG